MKIYIKLFLVNILIFFIFCSLFVLLSFLGGYASNSDKYQPELKVIYSILILLHIAINLFVFYRTVQIKFIVIVNVLLIAGYLLEYKFLA